ncbi:hypothetical protein BJ138DRAFT_1158859 [Hygrophoropsis aurantiaca]|uniref:Uncharacterized protein n=1 Tax=Hygrophoropsis aurantiaca TaxID=72124 RepID=A0ACB8A5G5_9AGAM|nr:hypothetical protein BJ138DRAFT_1158859 [Hygrophoropsis aurantiaca]
MTDPAFIQALQAIQTRNYIVAVAGALVAYDQVLTFAQEANATMYLAVAWGQTVFLLAMQAILVVRVYALFNRSKKVLVFLATFYCLQSTAVLVIGGFVSNNRVLHEYFTSIGPTIGSVTQIVVENNSGLLLIAQDSTIVSVVFDIVLLIFALWAFVRHALEAKTIHGGWSINALVKTMVADHLVYFICNLTWLSLSLAMGYVTEFNVFIASLNDVLNISTALAVVAGPSMVISLRAQEYKSRGSEGTSNGEELSIIRFGIRELPT